MKKLDERVENQAHHICHVVGENEGITLSDKSRHDVFHTVRAVADYWKDELDAYKEENHAKRWNELRLWMKYNPDATATEIFQIMRKLDNKEYIRGFKFLR